MALKSESGMDVIQFNTAETLGNELAYIAEVICGRKISGNGRFTELCSKYLADVLGSPAAFLTPSCTAALEMAAVLCNLQPGDEVIMPSYTFTSTANAVVLRGAIPVFVDIRPDTLNLDEKLIEGAITGRTKAIMVVHYAGVGCEMDAILEIAGKHGLVVIEDAAQAMYAEFRGKPLGSFGALAAFSFHETKNIVSGEGGALIVNDSDLIERAEIVWEKGTDRIKFKRGVVNKYNWVDIGSSFLPSEIIAAFLYAQLEKGQEATKQRLVLWEGYRSALEPLEREGRLNIPHPPEYCQHNGHIFYILAPSARLRELWLTELSNSGIGAVIHYVPLHSAPAGRKFGRGYGDMAATDDISRRLIRLPLHLGMTQEHLNRVIDCVDHLSV